MLDRIVQAVENCELDMIEKYVSDARREGKTAKEILNEGLVKGMDVVGKRFSDGEVGQRFQDGKAFVPQLLMAGRAMKGALELLKPLLQGTASTTIGKVVIGTVKGDLHDIGKKLVGMMFEGAGYQVVDLGVDVPAARYLAAADEHQADIIACSALLTTTMNEMRNVVSLVNESPLKGNVRVMIGGAPVTQSFCDEIGADSYTPDAATCAEVALGFCQK